MSLPCGPASFSPPSSVNSCRRPLAYLQLFEKLKDLNYFGTAIALNIGRDTVWPICCILEELPVWSITFDKRWEYMSRLAVPRQRARLLAKTLANADTDPISSA